MSELSEESLEAWMPQIPWRTPLPIRTPTASGLACRFCVAQNGIKARDISKLPQTQDEFEKHMKERHPTREQMPHAQTAQ